MELAVEKRGRRGPRGPGAPFGGLPGQSRQTDFPLRILVQSDMVGLSKITCFLSYYIGRILFNLGWSYYRATGIYDTTNYSTDKSES